MLRCPSQVNGTAAELSSHQILKLPAQTVSFPTYFERPKGYYRNQDYIHLCLGKGVNYSSLVGAFF